MCVSISLVDTSCIPPSFPSIFFPYNDEGLRYIAKMTKQNFSKI